MILLYTVKKRRTYNMKAASLNSSLAPTVTRNCEFLVFFAQLICTPIYMYFMYLLDRS